MSSLSIGLGTTRSGALALSSERVCCCELSGCRIKSRREVNQGAAGRVDAYGFEEEEEEEAEEAAGAEGEEESEDENDGGLDFATTQLCSN